MSSTNGAVTTGRQSRFLTAFFVCLAFALPTKLWAGADTALHDYVAAPDSAYSYTYLSAIDQPGVTVHLLSMTSQQWRTAGEVDRTAWNHWVAIVVPSHVTSSTGAIIVAGDDNTSTPPSANNIELFIAAQLAMASGTAVTVVFNVPNQPLTFSDAGIPQREDQLVAYSWDKAMKTGDWTWPAYLPMVKSVVRTMDLVQSVAPTVIGKSVDKFVVIGFSKRGATTWLTAAVDPRVSAFAPGVFDVLNMAPQFEHHFSAYGFYTEAVNDYVQYDIVRRMRSPEGQELLKVIDPYSYRTSLGAPKFMVNSPGDQFFLPDAGRFYLDDLAGEALLRYVPNTDHSLSSSTGGVTNALTSLVSWYQQVIFDAPRPTIRSTVAGGLLTVNADPPPAAAYLWKASNPTARDFRRETIGEVWTSEAVNSSGGGTYVTQTPAPAAGYAAYFMELVYPGVAGVPQTYSTRVVVTPDTLPYQVVDPILNPRGKGYWSRLVQAAITGLGNQAADAASIEGYLPIPLFDQYVTDLGSAATIFESHGDPADRARQHCLATRFNIASHELGWYSPVAFGRSEARPLWAYYQDAHHAYLSGQPSRAKEICESINRLNPKKVEPKRGTTP